MRCQIFMQDGVTPHGSRIRHGCLTSVTIDVLWPAKSPDINTIKNVLSTVMSRRINVMTP